MLVALVDRVWANTVLYLIGVATAWSIRQYSSPLISSGLLVGATVVFLMNFIGHVEQERKIENLGGHTAQLTTFSPWNISFLFQGITYARKSMNHIFWGLIFTRAGAGNHSHTAEVQAAGQRIIFTRDEENIKAILATQFQDYGKGPQFRKDWGHFLGLSIFTTDGEIWHNSRTLLRPQFIKDRVSDLHTFEHHIQELLPMLAGDHDGATVRLDDLLFRYTLDAATGFLFGSGVGSLKNGETEFALAFAEAQRVQSIIARAGPMNVLVPRKSFNEAVKILNDFTGRFIDEALALPQHELEKKTKSDEGFTFLHALASYTRDRTILRDQLVAVLLAGRDTTACTLSWLFYELSTHPEIVKKLRQEILSVVGPDEEPTYDHLKAMRYLTHTMNETLRLYPVVPYNVRVALKDTTLPHGGGPDGLQPIGITEGTPIGYSTFVMQRREDIYPSAKEGFPDPKQFVPDRWDGWTPKAWTYIPFNGGPRICIGQQFALTEMAYTVVRILQTFDTIISKNEKFPGTKADIVLQPADGVFVAFKKASRS
ncbi:cytochrome p450 like protein [Zymoseptoria brevis]|uniref:Cytochrome p450 like protein n=1 Tax=Zymoseptoria brevis TaxID=1047168 RepID=A0A0F4GQD4_9PEZI|nr:cytochrome p450 like protein [Zymoseptoria brevis]